MSLAEFEQFVFGAGHVADDDPIEFWRQQSARQQAVIDRLRPVRSCGSWPRTPT